MSNNKQSSVEWLSNQTYELFEQYSEGNFDRITLNKLVLEATNKAKEMHKEEMINFHIEVMKSGLNQEGERIWEEAYLPKISSIATQKYTETYGGKK
jgi:hypothetical protein